MPPTYVYNPVDTLSTFQHDSIHYDLKPNTATQIVSKHKAANSAQVAQYAVDRLGKWGVCIVSGPVVNGKASIPADQKLVDAAEATYKAAMTAESERVVLEAAETEKPRLAAGLPPSAPSPELIKAKKYLKLA